MIKLISSLVLKRNNNPSRVVARGLVTSRLPPFQDTPPIVTIDLLQVVDFWHINMVNLPQVIGYELDRFSQLFWANLMSYHLFFFLNFIPLYISLIYDVFLNKIINFWHINMINCLVGFEHGEIFTITVSQLDILSLLPFPLRCDF